MAFNIPGVESPRPRKSRGAENAALVTKGIDQFRIRRLLTRRRELMRAGGETPDADTQKKIDGIDAKIEGIKGVTDEDKRKERMREAQVRAAEAGATSAEDAVARGRKADARRETTQAREDELWPVQRDTADATLDGLGYDNDMRSMKNEQFRAGLDKVQGRDAILGTVKNARDMVSVIPELVEMGDIESAKDMIEMYDMMRKAVAAEAGGALKPGDARKLLGDATLSALVTVEQFVPRAQEIRSLPPEARFQEMVKTFEAFADAEVPQMRKVGEAFYKLWIEADTLDGGKGDQIITDEELDYFLAKLNRKITQYERQYRLLQLDRPAGMAGLFAAPGDGGDAYSPTRPGAGETPPAGGGTATPRRVPSLDDLLAN